MKKRLVKITVCAILTVLTLVSTVIFPFAEGSNASDTAASLQNDFQRLVCVSKYGNTNSYPENSVEGVVSAANDGADMVLVSVKKTSDNTIVLMADENLSRMCVDAQNNTVNKNISDIGYFELATYRLRNSSGLSHEKITAYTVPTLEQAIKGLDGKAMLLIDGGWQFRDEIYNTLLDLNALNSAVIIADGKKKEVSQWLSGKTSMPLVFSKYEGNVVWNSGSYIKKTVSAGVVGVILGDNNAYSTSFSASTVEKLQSKARAVIDMTDPKMCGNRTDSPLGWDDVTSRGFSVIITNNIASLCEYRERVEVQRERLESLIERASEIDLTLCSTVSANALKEMVAAAKLCADSSVSAMSIEQSFCDLQNTVSALTDRSSDDNGGKTITKGRIIAAVCVIAGLVIMEITFEYFRKKKVAARKLGRRPKKAVKTERK